MRDKEERQRQREERRELRRRGIVIRAKVGGNIWIGLLIVVIGSLLLAREFGFWFPGWIFTWPVLIILVGLFIGAKSSFRDLGWVVIIAVGTLFLLDRIYPGVPIHRFVWPVAVIGMGLIIVLGPRHRHKWWQEHHEKLENENPLNTSTTIPVEPVKPDPGRRGPVSGEDVIDSVAIFGGFDKKIFSKTFKGGEIVCIFGGGELNLTQADFEQSATINITAIFGGMKLTVPPQWSVRSQLNPVFGGIDDKRSHTTSPDPNKVLILKGTVIFGGVDIRSY